MATRRRRQLPPEWYEVSIDVGGDADIRLAAFAHRRDAGAFADRLAAHIKALNAAYKAAAAASVENPALLADRAACRPDRDDMSRAFLPADIDTDILNSAYTTVNMWHVRAEGSAGVISMSAEPWTEGASDPSALV